MNCREVSTYINAFADGELETRDNLAVLEHMNMCPACCRKVDFQQRLRREVGRVVWEGAAPASLRQSIRARLALETHIDAPLAEQEDQGELLRELPPVLKPWKSTGETPVPHGFGDDDLAPPVFSFRRFVGPLGTMAAVIAFVLIASWSDRSGTPIGGGKVAMAGLVGYTDESPQAVALANRILQVHLAGLNSKAAGRVESLPRDPREAALAMSRELGVSVLWCEKLADAQRGMNAHFEGAEMCSVGYAGGGCCQGAHMEFQCESGVRISVVSVPKLAELTTLHKVTKGRRQYVVLKPSDAEGQVTVIGFDCPVGSHFVCAPVDPETALRLIEPMKLVHEKASPDSSAPLGTVW